MTSAASRERTALADDTQFVLDDHELDEEERGVLAVDSTSSIAGTSRSGKGDEKGEQRGFEYARDPPLLPSHSTMIDNDGLPRYDSVDDSNKDRYDDGDGDSDDDDANDAEQEPNEKVYRYAKKLPNPATLKNANKKQPGMLPVLG